MRRAAKDEGAVLLTTIMIAAIMAVLAVSMIDRVRFSVKRAANVQAYAQADWYAQGAEDYASSFLNEQIRQAKPEQLNTYLMDNPIMAFPFEGGGMQVLVRDGSQCLSLGALVGPKSGHARKVFRQLLVNLGWSHPEAARLTSLVIDWQDEDQTNSPDGGEDYLYLGKDPAYRAPNIPISSVTELRAIETMSEDAYQALHPFVCARDAQIEPRININTLRPEHVPLLGALLGGDDGMRIAGELLVTRPAGGYTDRAALEASPMLENRDNKSVEFDMMVYAPEHIWLEADVDYLSARRTIVYEFSIEGGQVKRLYRAYGDEARRPVLESDET